MRDKSNDARNTGVSKSQKQENEQIQTFRSTIENGGNIYYESVPDDKLLSESDIKNPLQYFTHIKEQSQKEKKQDEEDSNLKQLSDKDKNSIEYIEREIQKLKVTNKNLQKSLDKGKLIDQGDIENAKENIQLNNESIITNKSKIENIKNPTPKSEGDYLSTLLNQAVKSLQSIINAVSKLTKKTVINQQAQGNQDVIDDEVKKAVSFKRYFDYLVNRVIYDNMIPEKATYLANKYQPKSDAKQDTLGGAMDDKIRALSILSTIFDKYMPKGRDNDIIDFTAESNRYGRLSIKREITNGRLREYIEIGTKQGTDERDATFINEFNLLKRKSAIPLTGMKWNIMKQTIKTEVGNTTNIEGENVEIMNIIADTRERQIAESDDKNLDIKNGIFTLSFLQDEEDPLVILTTFTQLYYEQATDEEKKIIINWAKANAPDLTIEKAFTLGFQNYLFRVKSKNLSTDPDITTVINNVINFVTNFISDQLLYFNGVNNLSIEVKAIYSQMLIIQAFDSETRSNDREKILQKLKFLNKIDDQYKNTLADLIYSIGAKIAKDKNITVADWFKTVKIKSLEDPQTKDQITADINKDLTKFSIKSEGLQKNSKGEILAPNSEVSILAKQLASLSMFDNQEIENMIINTRTAEFRKWMKVPQSDGENAYINFDKNNEPKVFFHGTNNNFNTFSKDKTSKNTQAKDTKNYFYFTDEYDVAESYAKSVEKGEAENLDERLRRMDKLGIDGFNQYTTAESNTGRTMPVFLSINTQGLYDFGGANYSAVEYDKITISDKKNKGFVVFNVRDSLDSNPNSKVSTVVAITDPSKIKSVENIGTFDTKNEDIRYSTDNIKDNNETILDDKDLDIIWDNNPELQSIFKTKKEFLARVKIEDLKSMYKSDVAGTFLNGLISLANNSDLETSNETIFHETFHLVWASMSLLQKQNILANVIKEYGDFDTFKKLYIREIVKLKDFVYEGIINDNSEQGKLDFLEEVLAYTVQQKNKIDEFRSDKSKNIFTKVWESILRIFNNLFYGNLDRQDLTIKKVIYDYYSGILYNEKSISNNEVKKYAVSTPSTTTNPAEDIVKLANYIYGNKNDFLANKKDISTQAKIILYSTELFFKALKTSNINNNIKTLVAIENKKSFATFNEQLFYGEETKDSASLAIEKAKIATTNPTVGATTGTTVGATTNPTVGATTNPTVGATTGTTNATSGTTTGTTGTNSTSNLAIETFNILDKMTLNIQYLKENWYPFVQSLFSKNIQIDNVNRNNVNKNITRYLLQSINKNITGMFFNYTEYSFFEPKQNKNYTGNTLLRKINIKDGSLSQYSKLYHFGIKLSDVVNFIPLSFTNEDIKQLARNITQRYNGKDFDKVLNELQVEVQKIQDNSSTNTLISFLDNIIKNLEQTYKSGIVYREDFANQLYNELSRKGVTQTEIIAFLIGLENKYEKFDLELKNLQAKGNTQDINNFISKNSSFVGYKQSDFRTKIIQALITNRENVFGLFEDYKKEEASDIENTTKEEYKELLLNLNDNILKFVDARLEMIANLGTQIESEFTNKAITSETKNKVELQNKAINSLTPYSSYLMKFSEKDIFGGAITQAVVQSNNIINGVKMLNFVLIEKKFLLNRIVEFIRQNNNILNVKEVKINGVFIGNTNVEIVQTSEDISLLSDNEILELFLNEIALSSDEEKIANLYKTILRNYNQNRYIQVFSGSKELIDNNKNIDALYSREKNNQNLYKKLSIFLSTEANADRFNNILKSEPQDYNDVKKLEDEILATDDSIYIYKDTPTYIPDTKVPTPPNPNKVPIRQPSVSKKGDISTVTSGIISTIVQAKEKNKSEKRSSSNLLSLIPATLIPQYVNLENLLFNYFNALSSIANSTTFNSDLFQVGFNSLVTIAILQLSTSGKLLKNVAYANNAFSKISEQFSIARLSVVSESAVNIQKIKAYITENSNQIFTDNPVKFMEAYDKFERAYPGRMFVNPNNLSLYDINKQIKDTIKEITGDDDITNKLLLDYSLDQTTLVIKMRGQLYKSYQYSKAFKQVKEKFKLTDNETNKVVFTVLQNTSYSIDASEIDKLSDELVNNNGSIKSINIDSYNKAISKQIKKNSYSKSKAFVDINDITVEVNLNNYFFSSIFSGYVVKDNKITMDKSSNNIRLITSYLLDMASYCVINPTTNKAEIDEKYYDATTSKIVILDEYQTILQNIINIRQKAKPFYRPFTIKNKDTIINKKAMEEIVALINKEVTDPNGSLKSLVKVQGKEVSSDLISQQKVLDNLIVTGEEIYTKIGSANIVSAVSNNNLNTEVIDFLNSTILPTFSQLSIDIQNIITKATEDSLSNLLNITDIDLNEQKNRIEIMLDDLKAKALTDASSQVSPYKTEIIQTINDLFDTNKPGNIYTTFEITQKLNQDAYNEFKSIIQSTKADINNGNTIISLQDFYNQELKLDEKTKKFRVKFETLVNGTSIVAETTLENFYNNMVTNIVQKETVATLQSIKTIQNLVTAPMSGLLDKLTKSYQNEMNFTYAGNKSIFAHRPITKGSELIFSIASNNLSSFEKDNILSDIVSSKIETDGSYALNQNGKLSLGIVMDSNKYKIKLKQSTTTKENQKASLSSIVNLLRSVKSRGQGLNKLVSLDYFALSSLYKDGLEANKVLDYHFILNHKIKPTIKSKDDLKNSITDNIADSFLEYDKDNITNLISEYKKVVSLIPDVAVGIPLTVFEESQQKKKIELKNKIAFLEYLDSDYKSFKSNTGTKLPLLSNLPVEVRRSMESEYTTIVSKNVSNNTRYNFGLSSSDQCLELADLIEFVNKDIHISNSMKFVSAKALIIDSSEVLKTPEQNEMAQYIIDSLNTEKSRLVASKQVSSDVAIKETILDKKFLDRQNRSIKQNDFSSSTLNPAFMDFTLNKSTSMILPNYDYTYKQSGYKNYVNDTNTDRYIGSNTLESEDALWYEINYADKLEDAYNTNINNLVTVDNISSDISGEEIFKPLVAFNASNLHIRQILETMLETMEMEQIGNAFDEKLEKVITSLGPDTLDTFKTTKKLLENNLIPAVFSQEQMILFGIDYKKNKDNAYGEFLDLIYNITNTGRDTYTKTNGTVRDGTMLLGSFGLGQNVGYKKGVSFAPVKSLLSSIFGNTEYKRQDFHISNEDYLELNKQIEKIMGDPYLNEVLKSWKVSSLLLKAYTKYINYSSQTEMYVDENSQVITIYLELSYSDQLKNTNKIKNYEPKTDSAFVKNIDAYISKIQLNLGLGPTGLVYKQNKILRNLSIQILNFLSLQIGNITQSPITIIANMITTLSKISQTIAKFVVSKIFTSNLIANDSERMDMRKKVLSLSKQNITEYTQAGPVSSFSLATFGKVNPIIKLVTYSEKAFTRIVQELQASIWYQRLEGKINQAVRADNILYQELANAYLDYKEAIRIINPSVTDSELEIGFNEVLIPLLKQYASNSLLTKLGLNTREINIVKAVRLSSFFVIDWKVQIYIIEYISKINDLRVRFLEIAQHSKKISQLMANKTMPQVEKDMMILNERILKQAKLRACWEEIISMLIGFALLSSAVFFYQNQFQQGMPGLIDKYSRQMWAVKNPTLPYDAKKAKKLLLDEIIKNGVNEETGILNLLVKETKQIASISENILNMPPNLMLTLTETFFDTLGFGLGLIGFNSNELKVIGNALEQYRQGSRQLSQLSYELKKDIDDKDISEKQIFDILTNNTKISNRLQNKVDIKVKQKYASIDDFTMGAFAYLGFVGKAIESYTKATEPMGNNEKKFVDRDGEQVAMNRGGIISIFPTQGDANLKDTKASKVLGLPNGNTNIIDSLVEAIKIGFLRNQSEEMIASSIKKNEKPFKKETLINDAILNLELDKQGIKDTVSRQNIKNLSNDLITANNNYASSEKTDNDKKIFADKIGKLKNNVDYNKAKDIVYQGESEKNFGEYNIKTTLDDGVKKELSKTEDEKIVDNLQKNYGQILLDNNIVFGGSKDKVNFQNKSVIQGPVEINKGSSYNDILNQAKTNFAQSETVTPIEGKLTTKGNKPKIKKTSNKIGGKMKKLSIAKLKTKTPSIKSIKFPSIKMKTLKFPSIKTIKPIKIKIPNLTIKPLVFKVPKLR